MCNIFILTASFLFLSVQIQYISGCNNELLIVSSISVFQFTIVALIHEFGHFRKYKRLGAPTRFVFFEKTKDGKRRLAVDPLSSSFNDSLKAEDPREYFRLTMSGVRNSLVYIVFLLLLYISISTLNGDVIGPYVRTYISVGIFISGVDVFTNMVSRDKDSDGHKALQVIDKF